MDHTYVEEQHIADRYVMGTLPAEEAEQFENHYLSCPECLDRLELAESVQRGFKRMAGQDAATLATVQQLAVVAWFARLGRWRQLGVLLAVLLVPTALSTGMAVNNGLQLAQARSTLKEVRQRSTAAGALQAELVREREARMRTEGRLAQALLARVNDTIAVLGVERGEPEGGGPTLHSPADGGWIILEVSVDPPYPTHAILRDGKGREVWRGDRLPSHRDTLSFSFPPTLLPPGDYSLTLEPPTRRFPFRVER